MTFDYIYHLTQAEVEKPSNSEQWAGQYNQFIAVGQKKEKADPFREKWKNMYLMNHQPPEEVFDSQKWRSELELCPNMEKLIISNTLPFGSFLIHFTFTLEKPYLSKDDNDFHIIDNPLVRDKVFRCPMVRPSSWKGSLRHALWQLGHKKDDAQIQRKIQRIFGEAREDNTGRAGRLYLYPSFFNASSLEIINPHDRKTRVAKNPILFECVPSGTKGTFDLLYVPFDCIGEDEKKICQEVTDDLKLITKGLQAMMTAYGFGAKTSSGFGTVGYRLNEGQMQITGLDAPEIVPLETSKASPVPSLPRYLAAPGQLKPEFLNEEGSFCYCSETELKGMSKPKKQLYDKAKAWWEREGKAQAEQEKSLSEPSEIQVLKTPPVAKRTFTNWDELQAKATELANLLMGGDV